MTTNRLSALAAVCVFSLLTACGGNDDGVKLGEFPALSKTEGDAPFKLTAPTSKSPAAFSYSSSDTRVATIEGDTVTVGIAGTTTITARQGELGSYNPTSTSAVLTVAKRVCAEPLVNENGQCVAPTTTAAYVNSGSLVWMPATEMALTWAAADALCKSVTIKGLNGGRLPTQFELTAMVGSGALAGKEWMLANVWTSNVGDSEKSHVAVHLSTNTLISVADDKKATVTCVR